MATQRRSRTTTVVVCGPSGAGKSTVGRLLAARIGAAWEEGDELHPTANVAKMAAGTPLTDADREPWLGRVAAWIGEQERGGRDGVIACSALRRAYRDVLRDGHASVVFVLLVADATELGRRLATRTGHYMPASLLPSQLETLEPLEPDEPGFVLDAAADPDALVGTIIERLGLSPAAEPKPE